MQPPENCGEPQEFFDHQHSVQKAGGPPTNHPKMQGQNDSSAGPPAMWIQGKDIQFPATKMNSTTSAWGPPLGSDTGSSWSPGAAGNRRRGRGCVGTVREQKSWKKRSVPASQGLAQKAKLRTRVWGGGCTSPCVRHSASSGPGTSSGLPPPRREDFAPAYPRPCAKKYLPQPAQWSSYWRPRLSPKHLRCPETAPGRLLLRSPTTPPSKTLLWDAPPSSPGS